MNYEDPDQPVQSGYGFSVFSLGDIGTSQNVYGGSQRPRPDSARMRRIRIIAARIYWGGNFSCIGPHKTGETRVQRL